MRDLQTYATICIAELWAIGIQPGKVTEFSVNKQAKNRWGQTCHKPDGTHTININYMLLDESVCESDFGLRNTLIHELLHTVDGCKGHKGKWEELANKVNANYGYGIKRCSTDEEKGVITKKETVYKKPVYNYKLICNECGHIYGRQKMCKVIKYPERFRCGYCNGTLKRCDN